LTTSAFRLLLTLLLTLGIVTPKGIKKKTIIIIIIIIIIRGQTD